jgi:hypothetical protein
MFCTDCETWDAGVLLVPVHGVLEAVSDVGIDGGVETFIPVGCVIAVLVEF